MSVYFVKPVGMIGPIKIGWSEKISERIKRINRWIPFDLEVVAETPGNYQAEYVLHRAFEHARYRTEWFTASVGILALIERIRECPPTEPFTRTGLQEFVQLDGVMVEETPYDRVVAACDRKGLRSDVSTLVDLTGFSKDSVAASVLRKGITRNVAARLAAVLDVSEEWLYSGVRDDLSKG